MTKGFCVAVAVAALVAGMARAATPKEVDDRGTGPWPADVKGFVPVAPGEHPRLLFRKSDLASMREKAKTAEGQAILKRLRVQLNGGDGESMPKLAAAGTKPKGDPDAGGEPVGYYTFSHAAGFGLLYQLTGEKKYADLGKECMDKAIEGTPSTDARYSFRKPGGALRAGPVLGWTALGYDLCYDGWEPAYREKVAKAIAEYNEGQWMSLDELARGARQHPGSNHWGMQVGGAAMALLGIMNDPGVDMGKITPLLAASDQSMKVNMTNGFGDGGFFPEGDGCGSMSSHIAFLSALQAWRAAYGKDYYTPRPNAPWMAMKWFFLTDLGGKPTNLRASFLERGAYPQNIWGRTGLSGGSYFGIAFGLATEGQKAGMLWFYNHAGLREMDEKMGFGLDAPSAYPHHSVLALVNWPVGMAEANPGTALPHAYHDSKWGFYAWRNRWQDKDDVIISILTKATRGNYACKAENTLTIQTGGKKTKWGRVVGGLTGEFAPAKDGSTVLTTGDGSSIAIDFSRASGADVMLIQAGTLVSGDTVTLGDVKFGFHFIGREIPAPKVEGNQIRVGNQFVGLEGGKIVLGKR